MNIDSYEKNVFISLANLCMIVGINYESMMASI